MCSAVQFVRCIIKFRFSKLFTKSLIFSVRLTISLVIIVFGVKIYQESANLESIVYNYDTTCAGKYPCKVNIQLNQKYGAPVLVYYEIENWIGNTKQYLLSVSYLQLRGYTITQTQANKCVSFSTNNQMGVNISYQQYPLSSTDIASPCGLQAKLFFTDVFKLSYNSKSIKINTSIGLSGFKNGPNSQSTQWIDLTSDNFQVWMTNGVKSTTRKYYGKIEQTLSSGIYTITIQNVTNYQNYCKSCHKNIVFQQLNTQYGHNQIIGQLLFIGGSVGCLLALCIFLIQ